MTAVFCLLLFMVLFLIWPWLETPREFQASGVWSGFSNYQHLFQEKDALLESLKDIEVDFQMGKLSEQDRVELRRDLSNKLMICLRKIEEIESKEVFFRQIKEDLQSLSVKDRP